MRKTFFLWVLMMCFLVINGQSQDQPNMYKTGIGVRLGVYPGFSFKYFASPVSALELIGQSKFNGVIGTVLYEAHFKPFNAKRFSWILGMGGHLARYPAGKLKDPDGQIYENAVTTVGIDGIFGFEYVFETAPLTLGLDIKPFFDMINPGPNFFDAAATIRFAF